MDEIKAILKEGIRVKEELLADSLQMEEIEKISEMIVDSIRNGNKVVLFGNGGSAADAQHLAGELAGKFKLDRRGLAAMALTTNTSVLTAIANDYGYEQVFSRQVEGVVKKGDVVIGISTSGSSPNVIEGIKAAKNLGAVTIGLTGIEGGFLKEVADICLRVPSNNTPRVQEAHITIGHIICEIVEAELFGCNGVFSQS